MSAPVTVIGSDPRAKALEHLRREWVGPAGGESETLTRSPVYAYLVGALFPVEVGAALPAAELDELEQLGSGSEFESFRSESVEDDAEFTGSAEPEEEDEGINLTGAFGWAPQSLGMSFIHDGTSVSVSVRAGAYREVSDDGEASSRTATDDADDQVTAGRGDWWEREQLEECDVSIPNTPIGRVSVLQGRATIAWRTRVVGDKRLTTIAVSNSETADVGRAKSNPAICLFQVTLECSVTAGQLHPYPTGNPVSTSPEDRELELRYRDKLSYGIGHGTAVTWDVSMTNPTTLSSDPLPQQEVSAIRPKKGTGDQLELRWLADESLSVTDLARGLRAFASEYVVWLRDQEVAASELDDRFKDSAAGIIDRIRRATLRIEEGIALLERGGSVLTSFRLANEAMRNQMLQQSWTADHPGRVEETLGVRGSVASEPRWRPFQLGFILLALTSSVEDDHEDRGLVDLIWFPTGGGKTEAYLGLAAIEMIRRRLDGGISGGGTAVITRYTMRLLTSQQFQRASTLICALEILRRKDPRLAKSPAFSIGLWLGNSTTPSTFKQAAKDLKAALRDAVPENTFQLRECPWCSTPIFPARRVARPERYGVRATNYEFAFFCPHEDCPFHNFLPVTVVDESIYSNPPTMLVATVDKFARLAWLEQGSALFGLGGVPFAPPSLVIQDELHLITGPLGTVVGVYESAIKALMSWTGHPPKVVASTATTRSSGEQVLGLMGAKVAVFPPSGLNSDDNYFAEPDPDAAGRMYVGIMPQAHTPSWALAQISTGLLQMPEAVELPNAFRDAYWTLVVYHNSLRELGRTVTILRDDVRTALDRLRGAAGGSVREMSRDGIEELNGNVKADDLLRILEQLSVGPDGDRPAIDALATTNILSVGIDVSRLGLMLVNGQPKSTSEYIQATSRVGRGKTPGLVVTMFRSGKPRDRSVFESFGTFHRSYYRFVEPSSVTPWSLQARRRALRACLVILMRQAGGLAGNDDAKRFDKASVSVAKATALLTAHIAAADSREAAVVGQELQRAVDDWDRRATAARTDGAKLQYRSQDESVRLLKHFTDDGPGWPAMNSMRSVDRVVRVRADGERR